MTPAQRNSLAARIAASRIQPPGYLEWADMTTAERESATQEAARWLDDVLAAGLRVFAKTTCAFCESCAMCR